MTIKYQPHTWPCQQCGHTVTAVSAPVECTHCGASYNCFGQRPQDYWRDNPSVYDDEISDLDGFEIACLRREQFD
jgi:hypothetical protein